VWVFVLHQPVDHDYLYSDMRGYVRRAVKLAEGGDLNRYDAFYPPGTHMLLAAPMKLLGTGQTGLWGGAVLWWAMSSLTPLLMWRLAGLLLAPAAAALTAVFCAAWPLHIMYAGWFLSETPSLFFLVLALWLGYRAGRELGPRTLPLAILAGLAAGVAIANRPQFLLNVAILAIPLLLGARRNRTALMGVAIGTAIVLGGVVMHNSAAAGKLTGLSENGGMNFWLGHCDVARVQATDPATNITRSFGLPSAGQRHNRTIAIFPDHAVWEQGFFYSKGIDCIRDDGLNHLALTARNVVDMTATTIPWPATTEKALSQVTTLVNVLYSVALPFIVLGAWALVRRRGPTVGWPGELVLLAHLLCFVPLALLMFGDSRFRIPYDVFGLALLAALVADRLAGLAQRGSSRMWA
jgi:4-amino-4-deoxy-L-arabinose transferase-like glycosyltransferase